MRKYPNYEDHPEYNKIWEKVFEIYKGESIERIKLSKIYHDGYCLFLKNEKFYKEIVLILDNFHLPYELIDVNERDVEIQLSY